MNSFCQDRDLLGIEPIVFLASGFPAQELIRGTGGTMSGTTFTHSPGGFVGAAVAPGMVLCTYATTPSEGGACEIVSVQSATQLVVSVLRADEQASAVAPPAGTNLGFFVRTFAPQIRAASDALAERLRMLSEAAGVSAEDFTDSAQLRQAAACGALAAVFTARAEGAAPSDANWIKAEHYRREYQRLTSRLRLAVDADGDGKAERTRTLGNVTLRRD
jgi:hypothetical protein